MTQATQLDLFDPVRPMTRAGIVPRDYQVEAHDASFRLWESGERGTLLRMFTSAGKTLTACLIADTWLRRGPDHRVMVVSYECELVSQFAEEVKDYLGIDAGVEMGAESVDPADVPRFVVASRQTLIPAPAAAAAQRARLAEAGLTDLGACTKRQAEQYLRQIARGVPLDTLRADLAERNRAPEVDGVTWSRLHKFRWEWPWLVIFDEAHRHAYHLASVGHIVDWFERNPLHRRTGLTATPKRADGVSIGHRMFPGAAIDYPLYSIGKRCAVRDGWAVPYVQRYIEVHGVDFKSIARVSEAEGADFDPEALEATLGDEKTLARLVQPMLDLCGDRRMLIFSPGVGMAKNVAHFINARRPCRCACGKEKWYAAAMIGDGAACGCGRFIEPGDVLKAEPQACSLDGSIPDADRKQVYRAHRAGKFQFLSVCGLCREGYNDPDIGGVAIFRPVSEKASSLAEQMKGRACRVLRELARLLHTLKTAAERVAAIAASAKPDALVIDLVGVTGLADCASTIDVYAEGLPDEVKARAKQLLIEEGLQGEADVEEAIAAATREADEARERVAAEREEAERRAAEEARRRARAQAEVSYTANEVGHGSQSDANPNAATEGQLRFIAFLGMKLKDVSLSKRQAGRLINLLRSRTPLEDVAYQCGLKPEEWEPQPPSLKQQKFMHWKGLDPAAARCGYDASQLIDAHTQPGEYEAKAAEAIGKAQSAESLNHLAADLSMVRGVLPADAWERLVALGRERRRLLAALNEGGEIPE